jgi:predicted DCC family thiol-disulfide oxidoreductase YuxK
MDKPKTLVIYDGNCMLCRHLAGFLIRRAHNHFDVIAWNELKNSVNFDANREPWQQANAAKLQILTSEGRLLVGETAWDFLLENYHDLDGLNWLAHKIGIRKQMPDLLERAGSSVRNWICFRCRR